ncbi:MAG: exodeoxyribonuclease VII small subunit [Verrucomicrobiota bacterium]|nr:exodeoxyribonuclease VII small subunit [Verrucomicrobiota bacterium]
MVEEKKKNENDIKLEDAIAQLETIVSEMESGKLPLETSMKKFEKGIKLSDFCRKELNKAEKKIEILVKKGNSNSEEWDTF